MNRRFAAVLSLMIGGSTLAGLLTMAPAPAWAQNAQPATGAAKEIKFTSIADTSTAPLDTYVFVRAKVMSLKEPEQGSRAPYALYVTDGTADAKVVVWQDIWPDVRDKDKIKPGFIVDIYAKIGEYREQRQLQVEKPAWVRLSPIDQSQPYAGLKGGGSSGPVMASIGSINYSTIGKMLHVRGTVAQILPSTKDNVPTKVMLQDSTGQIVVVYWKQVSDQLKPDQQPRVGKNWEAVGEVSEYRNELQLQVEDPAVLGPPEFLHPEEFAPTPEQTPPASASGTDAPPATEAHTEPFGE